MFIGKEIMSDVLDQSKAYAEMRMMIIELLIAVQGLPIICSCKSWMWFIIKIIVLTHWNNYHYYLDII